MALTIEIDHAKTHARAAAAAGQPVVPQAVKGRIRRIKWFVLLLTLSIYYVTPFLRWDRGPNAPDQALLLDFAHGRLYFFFAELWPQDLYLVTGLLVLASTILILTNALAGRLWCRLRLSADGLDRPVPARRKADRGRQAPALEEFWRPA
jgi:hypothetical protein